MSTSPPTNTSPPKSLLDFQTQYGHYLRDPHHSKRPVGIPRRPSKIYEELLFNNVCGFINNCFPVAKSLLSESRWRRLSRVFFCSWYSKSPYFNQIPYEFTQFVAQSDLSIPLPRWFSSLVHYEWVELKVEIADEKAIPENLALTQGIIALNKTAENLAYEWPVHLIGKHYRPRKPQPTFLVVFRDRHFDIHFIEINAVTSMLISIIAEQPDAIDNILTRLADQLAHPNPDTLMGFGKNIIQDFINKNILLGEF